MMTTNMNGHTGAAMLETVLDAIHGRDRGVQIPGHYGNGGTPTWIAAALLTIARLQEAK
jgi:hypothetical protein